ncbi:hypothetical protein Tco_1531576 [Tanacetum coccineum]
MELCGLLRHNLDVFAWKPADMTGVSRHIAEHRLNIRVGCLPIRQKKRGKIIAILQNSKEMHKEKRLPMDRGGRNGIQTNENFDSGVAYVNRTKRERGINHLPSGCKGSHQSSPNDGKGQETSAHLLR